MPSHAEILNSLHGGLIVSCQAPADSPLHQPQLIAAMAEAALLRGAVGVRIDTPAHIQAVRQRLTGPIIGLWKQASAASPVYITPQFHHAVAVAEAGADIIAIDATSRPRPGNEQVSALIHRIHHDLGKLVMADIDTLAAAQTAVAAGADLLGTTLYGYTDATRDQRPPAWALLRQLVAESTVPCLCEGGVASPQAARHALELGAFAVAVGTAITGIDTLVGRYCQALKL